MENKEPTKARVKELWEWCGFEEWSRWRYPNGYQQKKLPNITLNNLFKYAVPKVVAGDDYTIQISTSKYHTNVLIISHYSDMVKYKYFGEGGQDPALALFWAIWEVIHGE